MKKVGILTFHRASSYGAVMQALALQEAVRQCGDYDVEIIDYHPPHMSLQKSEFQIFCERYLRLSEAYYNSCEIPDERYDVIITGSDQVWNPKLINDRTFFLDFVGKNTYKMSYSASIGLNRELLRQLDNEYFKKYIPQMQAISVREHAHVSYVQAFAKCEVKATIDPVLLMGDIFFKEKFKDKRPKGIPARYILYHGVGLNVGLLDWLNLLSKYTGHLVIAVTDYSMSHFEKNVLIRRGISPEEWMYYIENAALVLTNSYHTMLFSILFKTPFYVYTAREHENVERILEVLENLDLQERKLGQVKSITDVKFSMDHTKTMEILARLRKESKAYLAGALEDEEWQRQ